MEIWLLVAWTMVKLWVLAHAVPILYVMCAVAHLVAAYGWWHFRCAFILAVCYVILAILHA
jgi:hypothetical protein